MQKSYSDVYQIIAGIRFQNTLRINSHILPYHPLRVHMSFTFPNQVLPQTVQTTHLFFPQLTPSAGQENRIWTQSNIIFDQFKVLCCIINSFVDRQKFMEEAFHKNYETRQWDKLRINTAVHKLIEGEKMSCTSLQVTVMCFSWQMNKKKCNVYSTLFIGTCELFAAISRQITDLETLVKFIEQPRTFINRSSSAAFFKTSKVVIPSLLDKDRCVSFSILFSQWKFTRQK